MSFWSLCFIALNPAPALFFSRANASRARGLQRSRAYMWGPAVPLLYIPNTD